MAAIHLRIFPSVLSLHTAPFLPSSSVSPPSRTRISCSCSSSSPLMEPGSGGHTSFTQFPYVSAPHRDLMMDLVSTVETRLDSFLLPSNLPPDVQSYQNQNGTAHGSLHVRSGVPSSQIDFILGSWLYCKLPSGGALNITSLSAYLNALSDAPNFLVELIQSSPSSMVLILDLPPRKDLVLNPDYLKTFYEDTQLDQHRQFLEKLPEEDIADEPLMMSANNSNEVGESSQVMDQALAAHGLALANILIEGDNLRLSVLKELIDILTPLQTVNLLVASNRLHLTIHE